MRVFIHRHPAKDNAASYVSFLSESRTYGMKSRSFAYSLLFHLAAVTILLVQTNTAEPPSRPIYDSVIRPQETKIIWQPLIRNLPDINSSTSRVKQAPSQGRLKSPQLVIADSKQGSRKEFVFQDKAVELPPEVKAPNLIALRSPAILETQQAPPRPPRREFVPPPAMAQPHPAEPATLPLPPPPVVDANPKLTAALPQVLQANPKVYRGFVAPQPVKSTQAGAGAASAPDAPNVDMASNANVAAVNLDSILGTTAELPPGRRPGNFSTGPVTGAPAAEKSGNAALVPGLTVRGQNHGDSEPAVKPEAPAPAPNIPKREIAYHEVMSRPIGSSLSIPLPPGARRIPVALDLKFHDRPVYTMILPAPKMPQYAGDWVLWFSEVKPSGGMAQIHAPLPEKQLVLDAPPPFTWGTEADIRINLVIDANGRVQSISIGQIPADVPPQIALEDLRAWQFKPATRNGVPIPVDAVLDIPFRRVVSSDTKH
jgi:hypothetical protein